MDTTIIVAILSALVSLIGTAVGAYSGARLTAYRIQQLEKKVDEHNNFAKRIPLVEKQIEVINKHIGLD